MSQRTIRHLCVLVVLALSLAFAVPGRADAAPRGADLWGWLENFLQERLVHLVRSEPAPARSSAAPEFPGKNGGCNDPNGCADKPGGGGSITSGGNEDG
jgi:hypothetical protein